MEIKGLVSIITPMYNSEKYILETYESIKNQTYKNWEWIVIDDNSQDKSIEIVEKIKEEDQRVILLKNDKNIRAAGSRNKGLDIAKGEYITFIDSDDLWDDNFLEKQLRILNLYKINVVFSSYRRCSENLNMIIDNYIIPNRVTYKDLLKENYISCLTIIFRKTVLKGIRFNSKLKMHEDYIMWLDILEKEQVILGNQEILATYRIHKNSVSRNKIKNLIYMFFIINKIKKYNLLKTFKIICIYSYFGLKKNRKIFLKKGDI